MKWSDMTVGFKLAVGFGLVLVLMGIISIVAVLGAERMRGSVEELNSCAEQLAELKKRSSDHMTWALDLGQGLLVKDPDRFVMEADPQKCPFGRWYYGGGRKTLETAEPGLYAQLAELEEPHLAMHRSYAAIRDIYAREGQKGVETANAIYVHEVMPAMASFQHIVDTMENSVRSDLKHHRDVAILDAVTNLGVIKALTPLALLVGLVMAVLIGRSVTKPLSEVVAATGRIAAGELDVSFARASSRDEFGTLFKAVEHLAMSLQGAVAAMRRVAGGDLTVTVVPQSERDMVGKALADMVSNLKEMNAQMRQAFEVLSGTLDRIAASTSELSTTASQAAASINETFATVEEVKQTALTSSGKAESVAENARKMARISQSGRQSTEDIRGAIGQIRERVDVIAQKIIRLSEKSQMIGTIISAVNDIADQSNLLAVNASIEASKAGEEGKGFAVVAHEIRNLSEQSKRSTARIRDILDDIQKATASAVMITEQGIKAVAEGERQVGQTGESIAALASSVSESANAATQIAAASREQLVGMEQVSIAVENINTAGKQNLESAAHLENAMRDLSGLTRKIERLMQRYKV
ncbi:MAG: methyl-accepting chemotaxis protein [Desulfovibrionaceae bacterium]